MSNANDVAEAFVSGARLSASNHSSVKMNETQSIYTLHGSVIATLGFEPKVLRLIDVGYRTVTTAKAMGAIVRAFSADTKLDLVWKNWGLVYPNGERMELPQRGEIFIDANAWRRRLMLEAQSLAPCLGGEN